jgi:ABC-type multidrug transport system fused ATPase/permease subunit
LSTGVDAYNAFRRIQEVFEAESLPDEQVRDPDLENALELDDASFSWDAPPPEPEGGKGKGKGKEKDKEAKEAKKSKKNKKRPESRGTDVTLASASSSARASASLEPEKSEQVFKIKKTNLKIPRGQVIAIVGPVGAGKSSLLQGLIGEMRKESGSVKFGGSVSYCPQNAWIQVRASTIIVVCLAELIEERHHPRQRLLRSSLRVGQVLASNFRLVLGCRLEAFPKRRSH